MNTITVSADQAAGLVFELFKAKPWINQGGVMQPEDACAEEEAVHFLLTLDTASNWGAISEAARRVANSLLLDFLARLMHPESPNADDVWRVTFGLPAWRQASEVIAAEIRRSHTHIATPH